MNIIGYTRVSTAEQADEGVSLDAQAAKIRDWCARAGHGEPSLESDQGLSGKRADNRPALQRALDAVCRGRGILVVYSLSRLCRSTRDAMDIAERLKRAGAHLVSITEAIDTTTAMGEFFFTVMAALAQLERRLIGERTKEALHHKRRNGQKLGGLSPFGYRPVDRGIRTPDGRIVIDLEPVPAEQAVIELIRELRDDGETYRLIADRLNSSATPTRTGAPWSAKVIRDICQRKECV